MGAAFDPDIILSGPRWRERADHPFDLGRTLPPWSPLLDMRPKRLAAFFGQEYILNPAATDAGRRADLLPVEPATREALGAEPPAHSSCDCPGCAPRVRQAPTVHSFCINAAEIGKALDAIAVAHAIRFAGLNTPDRKQMGAALAVRASPFTEHQTRPPPLLPEPSGRASRRAFPSTARAGASREQQRSQPWPTE